MNDFFKTDSITLYHGDCNEVIKTIADGSVGLCVTDPPYKIMPRGNAGNMGGFMTQKRALDGKIFNHNDIDIDDYIGELYRVLKDGTHCYIMTNNYNICHFLDVVSKSDFHFVKNLIWDKQNKICGRYYMGQYEYIIFMRKGKDRIINNCSCSDIISIPLKKNKNTDGTNLHDSEKPVQLMQLLVENSSEDGDLVFDPFTGSGTTAIACLRSNRRFVGCEIDKTYFDIAVRRIQDELSQPQLF